MPRLKSENLSDSIHAPVQPALKRRVEKAAASFPASPKHTRFVRYLLEWAMDRYEKDPSRVAAEILGLGRDGK